MGEETCWEKESAEVACEDELQREGPCEGSHRPEVACEAESDREDACEGSFHNKVLGRRGETAACRYLEQCLGFEVVERNWDCPAGEADIIAWDGDWLTFIEVKTRTSLDKGFPSESVTPKKRQRYEKIAAWYLKYHEIYDTPVRFDIIELLVVAEDRALIRHLKNAFGAA